MSRILDRLFAGSLLASAGLIAYAGAQGLGWLSENHPWILIPSGILIGLYVAGWAVERLIAEWKLGRREGPPQPGDQY